MLEIGAGLGNLTGRLMGRKLEYVAGEADPLYLHGLHNRFLRTPNVTVCQLNPNDPDDYLPWIHLFDSAICVNMLELVDDPLRVLNLLGDCLKPSGNLIVLVPHGPHLFGSLDKALGYKRRFTETDLAELLGAAGFQVEKIHQINRIGALSWWIFGKVLGRKQINRVALKMFDKTVWFWRRVDGVLPWTGLSLVAVAKRRM